MTDFARGSTWRKWDLQVQTILDDGYVSLAEYTKELKDSHPSKWAELCALIGGEELLLKYDSKAYFFNDTADDEKARAHNYARVFVGFLEVFHEHQEMVVCITDHNYYHNYLMDALLKVAEGSVINVLPGLEINVGGVHQLVIFNDRAYGKTTYSESIKHFLSQIGVHNAKTNGTLSVSSSSYEDVINEVRKCGAFLMYAHCNSTKGLFQERGKTDRTHLADQFNFQEINVLQARSKASTEATTTYIKTLPALKSNHVFTLGSDARSLQDTLKPDDAGNFFWVKADPTFYGLLQITYEPIARVFIGDVPPIMQMVEAEPTRFIDKITVNQVAGYDESTRGVWFKEIEVPLNPEMVVIIGNKGSGKSALADIIGLVGESKSMDAASFLNTIRFKKVGLARNFEAEITWASEDTDRKNLFDDIDVTGVEKVKYLPQRWFEELTNDLDGRQFSKELEKVVYTHLDNAEKLGYDSFADLLEYKTSSVAGDISELKDNLHDINAEVADYLKKLHPDFSKEIQAELEQKRREHEAHIKLEPLRVDNPDKNQDETQATSSVMQHIQVLDTSIASLGNDLRMSINSQVVIGRKIQNLASFKEDTLRIKRNVSELLSTEKVLEIFGEQADDAIEVTINDILVQQSEMSLSNSLKAEKEKSLNENEIKALGLSPQDEGLLLKNSLQVQLDAANRKRDELKATLEKPQELFQKYLEDYKLWNSRKLLIEGDKENPVKGTINYYLNELENVKSVYPEKLEEKRLRQKEISSEIYNKKNEVVDIYESVKSKVDAVIAANRPNVDDYSINIEAGFAISPDFRSRVLDGLNLRARGSFMGKESGYSLLGRIIDDKDPNISEDFISIQDAINDNLEEDLRTETRDDDRTRYIGDQVSDVVGFYDYLYGLDYLNENYQLRLDNKNLESLSPGEKGALLLVFYLMLDQDNIPLIIDQPEDNLDNQSVAKILVEFIKGAKLRRQIILVTHNPNLAIVADAEQIIYTHFDKAKNNTFTAVSGSIEDASMNEHIVDVLEGTMPAFDKRRLRYLKNTSV
jgi:ABC-type lipoprotein export system ATPase subunit